MEIILFDNSTINVVNKQNFLNCDHLLLYLIECFINFVVFFHITVSHNGNHFDVIY